MKRLTLALFSVTGLCSAATIDREVATLRLPYDAPFQQVTISKELRKVTLKVFGRWSKTEPIGFLCLKKGTEVQLHLVNINVHMHGTSAPSPEGLFTSATCRLTLKGKILLDVNTLTVVH
ncbi:MAG: hypothetical protein ACPG5R_07580 [Cognaticolwellia aestuarii]